MRRTVVSWSGTVEFTFNERNLTADVNVRAIHYYRPGRRYMPNGDPGYPEESEIEDIEWEETPTVYDDEGNVVPYEEDMAEVIDKATYDQADWEEEEPPEPPDDYYEERAMARWERQLDEAGL